MGFSTEQAYYEYYDSDITVAGTYTYRMVQQDFDGTLTNVAEKEFLFERPTQVRLYQNYPNPFNPSTTIRYDVPQKQKVQIRIYDIMGRTVQTLVNEEQLTGRYAQVYQANGLASGMYFFRLQSTGVDKTVKMTLVK